MCEPSKSKYHYEVRDIPCLYGKKFDSITAVLRAVAAKAAEYGVEHHSSVLNPPHLFPGAQGNIVKVATTVTNEETVL